MSKDRKRWGQTPRLDVRTAAMAGVCAVVAVLAGCDVPGTVAGAPTLHKPSARVPVPVAVPTPVSVTGTWVYHAPGQVETLHLRQHGRGVLGGDGTSTVAGLDGQKGSYSIALKHGRVSGHTASMTLYVTQLFGQGVTIVEEMHCATAARVLSCRFSVGMLARARNLPQVFYRH